MTISITGASGTIALDLVTGYEARRESRTRVHDVIGRWDPDVTLRPAGPRTGTLSIWCADLDAAAALDALHKAADVLELADTDRPDIDMSYVVDGSIAVAPEIGTERWIVSVDYREVLP